MLLAFLSLFAILISLIAALIDAQQYRIPDLLLAPAAVLALSFQARFLPDILPLNTVSALIALAALWIFALAARGRFGLGDVKLVGFITLCTGPLSAWICLVSACLLGLCWYALRSRFFKDKETLRRRLPFAPFLCAGTAVAFLAGLILA